MTGSRLGLRTCGVGEAVRARSAKHAAQAGFSLIEMTLVMGVVLFAFLAMSQSLGESVQLTTVSEETALATDAARELIETLDGTEPFGDVFALYNAYPDDDPDGPGSAPGAGFPVRGLEPAPDDPDQLVGEVVFPALVGAGGALELAEDLDDPSLGMPRDLNGDGDIDNDDHAGDYRLLPVSLRLRWVGPSGERTLQITTLLSDR